MKIDLSLFDYVFYRIYGFFHVRGDIAPETNGVVLLSIIQFFTILDIMILVKMVYEYPVPDKYYTIALGVLLVALNWYRYDTILDLEKLNTQWKGEPQRRKIKNGWLIGIYLLVSVLIPPIFGNLGK